MVPHFGRIHSEIGYALRMPQCTAAICLAQLEIVREQVAHRDKMARLLYKQLAEIPGIRPLPVPDYVNVLSCWMIGFNIDPAAFKCSTEEFAARLSDAGIPGSGTAQYYLLPAALTCLQKKVQESRYPYTIPPASRPFSYSADSCPNARDFLKTFVRWSTFCEKYQPEHCELAANIVRQVAEVCRA
jgi:dTDP-4-amino-4,6-dideoxygalactose transaminase